MNGVGESEPLPDDTILCGRPNSSYCVTVGDYRAWENNSDNGWSKKLDFMRRRLFERYIGPVNALDLHVDTRKCKNGFYTMAVSCLLIETLASYWRGWETTEVKGKSAKAIRLFFGIEPRFQDFRPTKFYKHVRCGILHSA
jgi:hypothetical protein